MRMQIERETIEWLLEGDPSIRWQVMQDLIEANKEAIAKERGRVAEEGWGARLLSHQDPSGRWAGQLYSHKWISTTYTLLLLRQLGLEPDNAQAQKACRELLDGGFREGGRISYAESVDRVDIGVQGLALSLLAYFGYRDERVDAVAAYLLKRQLPNGSWNPLPDNRNIKYIFDCTIIVLEGLREYEKCYPGKSAAVIASQENGGEFILRHRLYKSEDTGEPIAKNMTLFSFPPRWHYDVLMALDYFRDCNARRDERLEEAIDLVRKKRQQNGLWRLQNRHPGKTFFEMEEVGKPSRWNTLRALRVLKWWEGT